LDVSRNLQSTAQSKRAFAALEMSELDLLQQQQSSGGGDVSFFSKRNAPIGGTPDVTLEASDEQFDPAQFCPPGFRPDYSNQ
jgi:hypothetical protein